MSLSSLRLKALQAKLESLEGQLALAEKAAASSEAQKKSLAEEKSKYQKQARVRTPPAPCMSIYRFLLGGEGGNSPLPPESGFAPLR